MPGETTQRIVPCDWTGGHEPHPNAAGPGDEPGMCPGVPPRNPDGSLAPVHNLSASNCEVADGAVTDAEHCLVCAAVVPIAGELRSLTDEVRAAQGDVAARELAGEPAAPRGSTPLRAEEYAVTVSGIPCRVWRRTATDDVFDRHPDAPAWWEVAIGRQYEHSTTVTDHAAGKVESKPVRTTARFGFNPDQLDSEQIALERAGSYCEQVARALSALWQEQERIYEQVTGAVSRARVVCGALPEKD